MKIIHNNEGKKCNRLCQTRLIFLFSFTRTEIKHSVVSGSKMGRKIINWLELRKLCNFHHIYKQPDSEI